MSTRARVYSVLGSYILIPFLCVPTSYAYGIRTKDFAWFNFWGLVYYLALYSAPSALIISPVVFSVWRKGRIWFIATSIIASAIGVILPLSGELFATHVLIPIWFIGSAVWVVAISQMIPYFIWERLVARKGNPVHTLGK